MLSRHSVGPYQGNELTRNSPGNTRPQLSQLAELLWTDPSLKSGIGMRKRSPLKQNNNQNTHTHTQMDIA